MTMMTIVTNLLLSGTQLKVHVAIVVSLMKVALNHFKQTATIYANLLNVLKSFMFLMLSHQKRLHNWKNKNLYQWVWGDTFHH